MTCLAGSERGLINAKVLCAAGHQPSPYTKSITEMSVRLLSSSSPSLSSAICKQSIGLQKAEGCSVSLSCR